MKLLIISYNKTKPSRSKGVTEEYIHPLKEDAHLLQVIKIKACKYIQNQKSIHT